MVMLISVSDKLFVDSLIINPGSDGYSFPKERPSSSGGIGGSVALYSPITKYDGNTDGRLEWVDVNALTAVVGDVIDSLNNLGDVYVDHPAFNAFIGSNPPNITSSGIKNTSVGISSLHDVTQEQIIRL